MAYWAVIGCNKDWGDVSWSQIGGWPAAVNGNTGPSPRIRPFLACPTGGGSGNWDGPPIETLDRTLAHKCNATAIHPAVCQVLMADGVVKQIRTSVSQSSWAAALVTDDSRQSPAGPQIGNDF